MRRFVFFAMTILFVLTIITGFGEVNINPGNATINANQGHPGMHIAISILFITSAISHVVINRKPCVRYFKSSVKKAS